MRAPLVAGGAEIIQPPFSMPAPQQQGWPIHKKAMKTGSVATRGRINRDVKTMQIDRRISNGLAWAGVALVVGIPTADYLSGQFLGQAPRADTAQIAVLEDTPTAPMPAPLSQRPAAVAGTTEVAAAAPVATPAAPVVTPDEPVAQADDALGRFTQSGRALPSYITGAPAATQPAKTASVAPAPNVPATAAPVTAPPAQPAVAAVTAPQRTPIITTPVDPIQTASLPAKVAPVPMPLSMRPAPIAVATVQPTRPPLVDYTRTQPIVLPSSVQPMPPAEVTEDDLADWESGPLSEFLARRQGRPSAQPEPVYPPDEAYFYDDREDVARDRLIGPAPGYFPFVN